MTATYLRTLFSPSVLAAQQRNGSGTAYAAMAEAAPDPDHLGEREIAFLRQRDSLYMSTVGHQGWPYLQHRGGPRGFVRVLDPQTIGFAEMRGNRQYVSLGNLADDDRIALFFMDYAHRARLKVLGHARPVAPDEVGDLGPLLSEGLPVARIERFMLIRIVALDWNCPQYITPRFTAEDVQSLIEPLQQRIAELERERKAPT